MILYRLLSPLLVLVVLARWCSGALRGQLRGADLRQMTLGPAGGQNAIWIHAASVGEVNAARQVITDLARDHPILVTVTTVAARETVKNWALPAVTPSLAPLDIGWTTGRLLSSHQVRLLVVVENELWPARILRCHRDGVPVALLNARISASSARTWGRFRHTAHRLLAPMALISPQDDASAARLLSLGARPETMQYVANIKAAYVAQPMPVPSDLKGFERSTTLLAAATHPGEDEVVLDAFATLLQSDPSFRLIIAPRHPARGPEIATMARSRGLSVAQRSLNQSPDGQVYLADTLGEMPLWYQISGAAFIGGSLLPKGGHTPYEPVAYGCPILHGPHVMNFVEPYLQLDAAGAAVEVTDAATLVAAFSRRAGDQTIAQKAKTALRPVELAPVLVALRSLLD